MEVLPGEDIPVSELNDDTVGRVPDRIADVGTNVVWGGIAVRLVRGFSPDPSHAHQDVTGHKVYGDYLLYEDGQTRPHKERSVRS